MLRTTDSVDPIRAVIAIGAVGLVIALSNCGGNATDGKGNDAGAAASNGGSGGGGQGGVAAGGTGGTGSGGSSTATYTYTLPNTGTGTCYNDNVVTDPPPLPSDEPVCEYGTCANPTGTSVMGDIYYVPECVPSNNGACCGFPMEPSQYPGSLDCDKNVVFMNAQNECCTLKGSLGCPE